MSAISRLFACCSATLFCLLGGFSAAIALEGAWTDLNPEALERITTEHLLEVDFISASTGLIVGANGTILLTTDRGAVWVAVASGTGETLDGVDYIDAAYATAVGESGIILRSGDGGETWAAQSSGTTEDLSDVHFIDALTGWVVGDAGTVLRTTDGGANWIAGNSRTTLDLAAVSFLDAQMGYVVGRSSMLMQSFDGGNSWIHKPDVTVCYNDHGVQQCNGFLDILFLDASIGFVVGYTGEPVIMVGGAFFRTLTGGTSWLRPPADAPDYFDVEMMTSIAFGNATEGLILVSGKLGGLPEVGSRAYHTLDAGATWSQTVIPIPGPPYALSYGDENTAYAVGYQGTMLRWDRGGDTPTEIKTWGSIKAIFGD